MRIRSIKPEFWRSKDVVNLSYPHRLLFIGLWSYVDDNGVGRDDIAGIIGDLFSDDMVHDPGGTLDMVQKGLVALENRHLIHRYSVGNHAYLCVTNWAKHQRISHPNPIRYPGRDDALLETASHQPLPRASGEAPEKLRTGAVEQGNRGTEEQGREGANAPRSRGSRLPPDWKPSDRLVEQVTSSAPSVDIAKETETFTDYWVAKAGKDGVKLDWEATFRNWCRRRHGWNVEKGWRARRDETDEWSFR